MLQRYQRSKGMISKEQRGGPGGGRSDDTGLSDGGDLRWLPNVDAGTSRRAAETRPWSCGLEPTFAVSPPCGQQSLAREGRRGLLVPVNPLRHQSLVAEALLRNSAPFDARELLRKGHLL